MTRKKQLSVFTIAATYTGTVVGAGFASGQEVLQFFGYFGLRGILGLVLTTVLLAFFGYLILDLGRKLQANSHLPVVRYAGGKWAGTAVDWIITLFLFGSLVTMSAGAGAIFKEQLGLPFWLGSLVMIVISLVTVLTGIAGVVTSISFVVPLLLVAVFAITLYTLTADYSALASALRTYFNPGKAPAPFWPLTALLYASYNLVLSAAILAPLGNMSGPRQIKAGALLGGAGLGVGAAAIDLVLLTHINRAANFEIPMLYVAGTISPLARTVYTLILLAEIYTTAVSSLYGFATRLAGPARARYRWITPTAGAVAFILAQFGFSNLVGTLFPAVGFAGLILLGSLFYGFVKDRLVKPAEETREAIPAPPVPALAFEVAEELAGEEQNGKNAGKKGPT